MLTPAVTFAAYAISQLIGQGGEFQLVTAFTAYSLLSILINPIAELVTAATNLASTLSCLDRMQEFLEKKPLSKFRGSERRSPTGDPEHWETQIGGMDPSHRDQQIALSTLSATRPEASGNRTVIRIRNASFGYRKEEPVIHDISLDIPRSAVILVVGPVGSGKSTLLRSILGETDLVTGRLDCDSPKQFAYCDQEPWILNLSIKENILSMSEYDEERYQEILKATGLQRDLSSFPRGDETLTGNKGLRLSGGQRSRLVSLVPQTTPKSKRRAW
jgi:ABC-type multidrug transport system fused ATPase/permease subunit